MLALLFVQSNKEQAIPFVPTDKEHHVDTTVTKHSRTEDIEGDIFPYIFAHAC